MRIMKKPLLFILVAPSGSGKTTIRRELQKRLKGFFYSVSATTRRKREGEKDGSDYIFLTPQAFRSWQREGKFLETVRRYGNCYGTPKEPLLTALAQGRNCLLDLEPSGVKRIKELFPKETVTIFLQPPSVAELRRRLRRRPPEEKKRRLFEDKKIFSGINWDYSVLNKDLKEAIDEIIGIIKKELKWQNISHQKRSGRDTKIVTR